MSTLYIVEVKDLKDGTSFIDKIFISKELALTHLKRLGETMPECFTSRIIEYIVSGHVCTEVYAVTYHSPKKQTSGLLHLSLSEGGASKAISDYMKTNSDSIYSTVRKELSLG